MNENIIVFRNLNESPMSVSAPKWQREIVARVEEEYQEKALETAKEIEMVFKAISPKIKPGYFATAFQRVLNLTPRYEYIKNVSDGSGGVFDVEIDLALHTVSFVEVERG